MTGIVYLLCAATALICCVLLLRGHRSTGAPLLFWSSLCFGLLTLDNLFLFADRILLPAVDLTLYRRLVALVAVAMLLYGMIFKSK
ncbi:MAG: hypothetical protein HZC54_21035 [Verrucomicrobia bacterium]|nr:hypothetical protein [Verrucomicrobiota bacterium]